MKYLLLFIFTTSLSHLLFADPPEPKIGERWVLNNDYSDEFNGTALDKGKWKTTIGGWKGRQPAFFNPDTPIVNDGNMVIRNQFGVPANAPGGYTISGGAVQSIKEEAHFGYYECNFRSSRINMSTTFWLSSSGRQETRTADTNDTYSQELDICESIGGAGNFSSDFRKKMKFNTHYRLRKDPFPTPETFYSKGNNQVEIRDGELVGGDASLKTSESWEDYHTYACHWRSAQEAAFYVDNRFIGVITFRTDIVSDPFKDPMRMNMVTETYNWARPLPTEQQLNNDNINASYYNWVRSYVSLGIDENNVNGMPVNSGVPGEVVFIDFENNSLNGWSKFGAAPDNLEASDTFDGSNYALRVNGVGGREYVVSVNPNTNYTLKAQIKAITGSIAFGIKQTSGTPATTLASETITDTNFKETTLTFNSGANSKLKFFLFAADVGDNAIGDNFELFETDPSSTPINNIYKFPEELSFFDTAKLTDNNSKVEISYLYKTNQKNTFRVKILDKNNIEVDEVSFDVLAGYGKNKKTITLNNVLPAGEYAIKGEIVKTTDTGSIVLSDSEGFTTAPPNGEVPPVIASDNFKVLSTGLSCPDSNNGSISIEAAKSLNYSVSLKGPKTENKNFNDTISFDSLSPGSYELEITTNQVPGFKQVLTILIKNVEKIATSTKILDNTVVLSLSGATSFQIQHNDELIITDQNQITLELEDGVNSIEVHTDKDCQGKFSKKIILTEKSIVTAYPNPAIDILHVSIPNTEINQMVSYEIYSISGGLVEKQYLPINANGEITINVTNLSVNMYFLKTQTENTNTSTIKFVKR